MANTKTPKNSSKKTTSASGAAKGNSQLEQFFHEALKDLYWAEKHLVTALPKMQEAATSEELKKAIGAHITQTEEHVNRLDQVFKLFGWNAQAKKCDAMQGLIEEGESILEETEDGTMTRDAAIIMAAQKVEHYEIATYGGLVQIAMTMGNDEAADILNITLEEEKETDQTLSAIAEGGINWEAEQEGSEEPENE
ncbi:MAG TPA: ferritin-like domain-containing protein [Niastella sp.]